MRLVVRLSLISCVILSACCLGGCGAISSLQFDDRLVVKMPGAMEVTQCQASGWKFRHVAEGPNDEALGVPVGQWYLAWHETGKSDNSGTPHFSFPWSRWVFARHQAVSLMDASHLAFGTYPIMIEPDFVFATPVAKADETTPKPLPAGLDSADQSQALQYRNLPSPSWPNPVDANGALVVGWHLGDKYTQLTSATKYVESHHGAGQIRIGILDDGFSAQQAGVPEQSQLIDSREGDAMGMLVTEGHYSPQTPGSTGASHGTGTMGILAGRNVKIPTGPYKGHDLTGFSGYLGGAPRAKIVPVRIAPWVFSITTANLAYGIDYASRHRHCDVISLSHGGSPCQVWADAVNAAYERGTAMFAAEGDFFSILSEPIQPRGIIVPSSPVYPAAFRRVMGVTGVTSDGDSYAENRLDRLLAHPFDLSSWMARGSYGPKGSWRTALGMNENPDTPTVNRQGSWRAYPIAAYSPNIPWLVAPSQDDPSTDLVDLDGAGTSAATPQVAAAAALWLDCHRAELAPEWNTWKKAEAVYVALLLSAHRDGSRQWPDRYLGAGTLKARDALDIDLQTIEDLEKHPRLNPDGTKALTFTKADRDFFDGSRSFASLFGLADDQMVYRNRADLDQRTDPTADRHRALVRMFYNTLLLQAWHAGHLPKGENEISIHLHLSNEIEAEAESLAQHYLNSSTK